MRNPQESALNLRDSIWLVDDFPFNRVTASISFSAFPASNAFGFVRCVTCQDLFSSILDDFNLVEGSTFELYSVKQLIGVGQYGKVYLLNTPQEPNELVVLKVQRELRDPIFFETEVQVLSSIPQSCQFSTAILQGTIGDVYNFIIMTHCGICLRKMLRRKDTFCFTLQNTLRIGFQLFDLVHLFHSFGWLHKDIHWGNVTINTDAYGRLKMGMIDYGLCVPLNGPDVSDFLSQWHTSLYSTHGCPYTETDDFVSVVFLLMRCLNLEPFGHRVSEIEERKAQFHASPDGLIDDQYHWIWNLYHLVESQRSTQFNNNTVKNYIRSIDRSFNPITKITYTKRNGLVIID